MRRTFASRKQNPDIIMTKKRLLAALYTTAVCCTAMAQSLTLDGCRRMAQDNYPAIKQYGMIERSRDYNIANAAKSWLPQVSLSAGGYGFTNIIDGGSKASMMGLDAENFVASASVVVKQNIYDGGKTSLNRRMAKAEADIEAHQLDVTMYDINSRVEQIYFSLLLIDEQLKQNSMLQSDLDVSLNTVESMMQGGMANQSDKDVLRVEQLKTEQRHDQLTASHHTYMRMLSRFVGITLSDSTRLEKPSMINNTENDAGRRPEMRLFAAQEKMLDLQRNKLDAALRPTIEFMGMGTYHTKVSELVNNGFLLGGLSVSWNIGVLYTRKNDLRRLDEQRLKIGAQRETFLFNNTLQQEETDGTVVSLRKQLAHDDEIVSLRESIRTASRKKVELGTMSVNDLVQDINAVAMARAQRAEHEVLLLQALYRLRTLNNGQ